MTHQRARWCLQTGRLRSGERNVTRQLAGPEALARGTRGLINRAEESSLKRAEGAFRGEEAEAAMLANDDARRSVANLNDVGRSHHAGLVPLSSSTRRRDRANRRGPRRPKQPWKEQG